MTKGELLQKTFPNSESDTDALSTKVVFTLEPRTNGQQLFVFDKDWWNAECEETADYISKTETLKAMDSLDKFVYTAQYGLERLDKDDTGFVAYVKYEDVLKCIKGYK